MKDNKPLIYPFRTPKNYYIYDTNRNAILGVNKNTYNFLLKNDGQVNREDKNLQKEEFQQLKYMIDKNFLLMNKPKRIEHPSNEIVENVLENKLQSITLQVTQQCNLRCKYCTYSGSYVNRSHADKMMNISTAKKAIDFFIGHSQNSKILNVGFYGGEPLLAFNIVKESIKYAVEKAEGKKITFNITTNATLLREDIVEFFEEYDVDLMISLDGPRKIQDKNRQFAKSGTGTFDVIMDKMKFIKEKFPEYYKKITFNAVIDPSLDFTCSNEFFANEEILRDSLINANFVSTDNLSGSEEENEKIMTIKYMNKYYYEIFKMFLAKLEQINKKYVSKIAEADFDAIKTIFHDHRNLSMELPESFHHGGPCIPGAKRLFVNIKEELFPCEKCSETSQAMKIGTLDEGFYIDKVKSVLNIGKLTEEECKNCWAIRLCTLCAITADDNGILSKELKCKNCESVKNSLHNQFVEYCMLNEFGYKFKDSNYIIEFTKNQ